MNDAAVNGRIGALMMMAAVGSRFRFERRIRQYHDGAQSLYHLPQHIIVGDAQPAGSDLQCNVAVAQMLGNACKLHRVRTTDLQDFFRSCRHPDDAAILRFQEIAVAQ